MKGRIALATAAVLAVGCVPPKPPPAPGDWPLVHVTPLCTPSYGIGRWRFFEDPTAGDLRIWSAQLPGYMDLKIDLKSHLTDLDLVAGQMTIRVEIKPHGTETWFTNTEVTGTPPNVPC